MRNLFLCLTMLACHKTPGGNDGVKRTALKTNLGIDMSSVKAFVLAEAPVARESTVTQAAYAVDASNQLVEIKLLQNVVEDTDENGNKTTRTDTSEVQNATSPKAVFDTPLYVFLSFESQQVDAPDGSGRIECSTVLIRKSDGALFCAQGSLRDPQSNLAGDLVAVRQAGGAIVRLDLRDPAAPVQQQLIELGQYFLSNDKGDVLLAHYDGVSGGLRIYKENGGLQNIGNTRISCITRGLANQGNDFYFTQNSSNAIPRPVDLHRITRQPDGSFADSVVNTFTDDESEFMSGECQLIFRAADRLTAFFPVRVGIMELVGPTGFFTRTHVPALDKIASIAPSTNNYFVLGTDTHGDSAVVAVTPTSGEQTTLLAAGAYSIDSMTASNGELTFSGVRNNDGHRVLGVVPAGANAPAIWSEQAPKLTALVRIH